MNRWMMGCLGIATLSGLAFGTLWLVVQEPLPAGQTGEAAEVLTQALEAAAGISAWKETGAIQWKFAGHSHLWDRDRELYRLEDGDEVVLLDLQTREGRAWQGEEELSGEALSEVLTRAWGVWCNDTFWLNPLEKLRDPGITRSLVDLDDGRQGLLVTYASGGVTPGDSYLWIPDEAGRPVAWRMWVSVIPIPGIEMSWAGWQQLPTGAWVSTVHQLGPLSFTVNEVTAAPSLPGLLNGADDPFAALTGT